MAVGRYYRSTPFRASLYTPDINFVSSVAQLLQQTYDQNFILAEQLRSTIIPALPKDRLRADQITQQLNQDIDNIVKKYSGDYSQASKDLYKLKVNLSREMQPGRELYTIVSNYKDYLEKDKKHRELLSQGKITLPQYQAWKSYIDRTYKGAVKDPITQTYSTLNAPELVPYVDGIKAADEAVSKLPKKTVSVPTKRSYDPNTGLITYTKETREYIDPNEAAKVFAENLRNNPGYLSYVVQYAQLTGQDPNELIQKEVQDYVTNVLPSKTGDLKVQVEQEHKANPIALENYRHQLRLDYMRQKNALMNSPEGDGDLSKMPLSVLGIVQTNFAARNPVDVRRYPQGTIQSIINDPSKYPNVNSELLRSIRDSHPGVADGVIWSIYNSNINRMSYGSELYYYSFSTNEARKAAAERIAAGGLSLNNPLYIYDMRTNSVREANASERQTFHTNMFGTRGTNNQTDYSKIQSNVLGLSSSATGHLPVGYVINNPSNVNEKYVLSTDLVGLRNYNLRTRNAAFGFIQDPNRVMGEPFQVMLNDGTSYTLVGVKETSYNPKSKTAEQSVYYYPAQINGNNISYDKKDPVIINGVKVDPMMMEHILLGNDVLKDMVPHRPSRKGPYSLDYYDIDE